MFQCLPPVAPLQPWQLPQGPWASVDVDYAGPFLEQQRLILVGAHSKWIEVKAVTNVTSTFQFCHIHGLPKMLVSDNRSVFTSTDFSEFVKHNSIQNVKSPLYHSASNGLVERAVQTFKVFMKKSTASTIKTCVLHFLSQYRITAHSTTGVTPAEMLFGHRPRTRLDIFRPGISNRV